MTLEPKVSELSAESISHLAISNAGGLSCPFKMRAADDPTPLLPENHEKAIQEVPREPDVVEIFKQIIGAGPLPPR